MTQKEHRGAEQVTGGTGEPWVFSLTLSITPFLSPTDTFLNLCLATNLAEDSHSHPVPLKDRAHVLSSHSSQLRDLANGEEACSY